MSVTVLDEKSALIIVDLQKGIAGIPTLQPLDDVVENTNLLSAAFRRRGLPVVLVVAAGGSPGRTQAPSRHMELPADFTELLPALATGPDDHRVVKYARGAFSKTDLEEYLSSRGVTQVVLTGVATSNGVESTARQAYEAGLNVTLATDAMTDANAEAETYSLTRVFPKIAELGTAEEIVGLLAA